MSDNGMKLLGKVHPPHQLKDRPAQFALDQTVNQNQLLLLPSFYKLIDIEAFSPPNPIVR